MTYLDDFSKIIERQAAEHREREDFAFETALAQVEETQCAIDALSDADLLDYIMSYSGTSDWRMQELNERLRGYGRTVALARMERK